MGLASRKPVFGVEVNKLCSCSTQMSMKSLMFINVKMPTIVGRFDTVPDVQHLENKDSFYMIVAGSLHRLLCEVHGDAL